MSYNNSNNEFNYNSNNLSNIQLKEFGQTPEQIFFKPHPKKFSKKIIEIPLKSHDIENKIQTEEENAKLNNEIKEDNNNNNKVETKKLNDNEIKNMDIIIDINNEKEIKNENKKEEKNNKIGKYNNANNMISNSFKVFSDFNLKLKKQYKSVKKYDNTILTSGTILPDSNLIISSGINGYLNAYDYYSGEITKSYSLSCPIENINSINKNNLIVYSSDYSINTFNISLGKNISSFYAHDTNILNLFYDEKTKNFISCNERGIIHLWDINQKYEIPIISHYLFGQNKIINVDYNSDTQYFYSLDDQGKVTIINIYNDEELNFVVNDNDNNNKLNKPISICSNLKNLNEVIIGYEKGFKIFDVRNTKCIEDFNNIFNFKINKCIMDTNNILIQNEYELKLFDYKEQKIISERNSKDRIKFFNFYNFSKDDTRILYGDEKGNIFYSVI